MLTMADVLEALSGTRLETASQVITEASIDSRQVIPGALFVALPGERMDGHDFIGEAFQRGAHLALIQRNIPLPYPVLDLRKGLPAGEFSLPELPFCLLVDDTLHALQQVAHFWRRKLQLTVVGITGSVGKSTTKELVAEVLEQRYRTLKNPGNLNNEIGLPMTLLR